MRFPFLFKAVVLIFAMFSSASLFAASKKVKPQVAAPPMGLYQVALAESTATPLPRPSSASEKKLVASAASAASSAPTFQPSGSTSEGMLKLKDTYNMKPEKTWNWRAGLSLQQFGSEGAYTSPVGSLADLREAGKVWMPILDFGLMTAPEDSGFFSQGLIRAGYARQNLSLETAYGSSEVSVNSLLLAAQPQVGYQNRLGSFGALVELGRLSYSQTYRNEGDSIKTDFTRSLDYFGYGLSAEVKIHPNLRGHGSWIQRQSSGSSPGSSSGGGDRRIQATNLEAGLSVLW